MLAKGLLNDVQRSIRVGDALDSGDLGAIGLDGEHHAGFDRLAVEIDGAGAAMAGVAADVGAGEILLLAKEMDKQRARLGQRFHRLAIDRHLNMRFGHRQAPPLSWARRAACSIARLTITPATLVRKAAGPRPSSAGAVIASAAWTAASIAVLSTVEPTRRADAASANKGVSATLVSPIEACSQIPSFIERTTAAAAVA
jgi:hypothetical protein